MNFRYFIDVDGVIFTVYSVNLDGIADTNSSGLHQVVEPDTILEVVDDCDELLILNEYTLHESLSKLAECIEGSKL